MSKFLGSLPAGARLERVRASPNYVKGRFANLSFTPDLAEDASMWRVLKAFTKKPRSVRPPAPIPAVKPDFGSLLPGEPSLIWFGHSSYYLQAPGLKMLVDPVFSGRASPVPGMVKAFEGTDIISAAALPQLDYVLITHDHYDHLDYQTVLQLKPKTRQWLTSLGTGAHLEAWGIPADRITELDWWETASLENGYALTATPARHFSGRGLKRAQSMWASFVLKSPKLSLYLGGDSGWDTHFTEIGERYGPFDLAILECGQYHPYWKHIHMMPEEVADAATQLGARRLLPVHWGKFNLALHPWDEPIERVRKAAAGKPYQLLTPVPGQSVRILSDEAHDQPWWHI